MQACVWNNFSLSVTFYRRNLQGNKTFCCWDARKIKILKLPFHSQQVKVYMPSPSKANKTLKHFKKMENFPPIKPHRGEIMAFSPRCCCLIFFVVLSFPIGIFFNSAQLWRRQTPHILNSNMNIPHEMKSYKIENINFPGFFSLHEHDVLLFRLTSSLRHLFWFIRKVYVLSLIHTRIEEWSE